MGGQVRTDFEGPAYSDAERKGKPVLGFSSPVYEDVGSKTHLPAFGQPGC